MLFRSMGDLTIALCMLHAALGELVADNTQHFPGQACTCHNRAHLNIESFSQTDDTASCCRLADVVSSQTTTTVWSLALSGLGCQMERRWHTFQVYCLTCCLQHQWLMDRLMTCSAMAVEAADGNNANICTSAQHLIAEPGKVSRHSSQHLTSVSSM